MLFDAPAKINWALKITGRRENGYHELDMLMQTVSLCDTIDIEQTDALELTVNGTESADAEGDLCVRAVRALEKHTGRKLPVRLHVTKRIPARAGLGGGSSDCAAVLKAVNALYALGMDDACLQQEAIRLGADVPFFLYGGLCRVQGIGEKVTPLKAPPPCTMLLYQVNDGLSTPEVYARFDRMDVQKAARSVDWVLPRLMEQRFDDLKGEALNDLEPPAIHLMPEIARVKQRFLEAGALHALMSGSGSAVYAVFEDEAVAKKAQALFPGAILARTTV